ncbi:hypothetical protein MVEG_03211 [Podila verticillata NRRL 6337]|nr:hypothetical protein MVEG_03211 [Podila verticillata NRRL 6337]
MTSSSRLASNNHKDQLMDANLDQANDTSYSQKHTTLIKEEQHTHSSLCRSKSTVGGTSSYHNSHHHHHQQQQTEAPVEIYRDPSPDAADSFHDHHHSHQQQNTMDPDYGDQENIRPLRARATMVGDLRAQSVRGHADNKTSSSCSSSSSHPTLQRRPSAKTELLERSRPQGTRPSTSSVDAHQQQAQSRNAPAPLVKKRSHYVMDEDPAVKEPYEQAREQLKQTHVGKSVAGAPTRVDAPKKQRREAVPGAGGQQQLNGGGQTTRQRGGGASSSKQGEDQLTEEELKEVERKRRQYLRQCADDISYGSTYEDAAYEYRNVILPKAMFQWLPRHYFVNLETAGYTLKLLSEPQWRAIGLQMSPGWEHYMQHAPEPHIMPFRRDLETSRRVRLEQKMAAAASGKGKKEEEDVKMKAERP